MNHKFTKAIIFLNGNTKDLNFTRKIIDDNTMIIGCDGGADAVYKLGLKPNAVVGDFDSIKSVPQPVYDSKLTNKEIIFDNIVYKKYPSDKDFLDVELAIDFAVENNIESITLVNNLGNELDHILGTVYTLLKTKYKNLNIKIVQENQQIFLADNLLTIEGRVGEKISLIPISGEVKVKNCSGLKYNPSKYKMSLTNNIGISNEFTKTKAKVDIVSGVFLVVLHTAAG